MGGGRLCYPGSDVLINRYQIKDKNLLEKLEIQKVAVRLLGLDVAPERIPYTYDKSHLIQVHKYLFGDIYEWAGELRKENLFKSERVLSGGSATYAECEAIEEELSIVLNQYNQVNWVKESALETIVTEFLLALWSIHPFREGNTRTCITFLWHYLKGKGIEFRVELLKNNPMYVRDSLVMANYNEKQYLQKIISDALVDSKFTISTMANMDSTGEKYQIAKADYEAFREKYAVIKG